MSDDNFDSWPPAKRASYRLLKLIRHSDEEGNVCTYDPWPYAEISLCLSEENTKAWRLLYEKQQEAEKNYKGSWMRSPNQQHLSATRCLQLKSVIETGDGGAVLEAVACCATNGLVMPAWLAVAFVARYNVVAKGDARDWSDTQSFGTLPKGTNIASIRADAQLAPWAYEAACQLIEKNHKRPLTAALYEEVGETIGASQTQVQTYIKGYVKLTDFAPLKYLKERLGEGQTLGAAMLAWQSKRFDEHLRESGYVEVTPGV